jgi:N6-L-threonylcarbamoyladenine synthase
MIGRIMTGFVVWNVSSRRILTPTCAWITGAGPVIGPDSTRASKIRRASFSATSMVTAATNVISEEESEKRERRRKTREKRKKFIGLAKAVDRGQYQVTYQPGGVDGKTFQSLSGLPERNRVFTVLGIESSCDDTGAAVVRSDGVILGEALASQQEIHEAWGGVVPGLARDAHVEKIDGVVEEALAKAGMTMSDIDAVGVTVGPGLEICLRVGCTKARELAIEHKKPFVGIHHLEAHILMARLPLCGSDSDTTVEATGSDIVHLPVRAMDFPFLALLVSGGHCQLMRCMGIGSYTILGGTLDDSLGEAFDKTARLLGLPTGGGGGPAVEKLARDGDSTVVTLPIPLRQRKDMDFSYAGLKTAVRKVAEKMVAGKGLESVDELPYQDKANIAASFQNVAIKHLEQRLKYAMTQLEEDSGIRTLTVVGGVAANTELRTRLQELCLSRKQPWTIIVPPPRLCTDQGAMSAWAAVERIMVGSSDDPAEQEVFARFPFSSQ